MAAGISLGVTLNMESVSSMLRDMAGPKAQAAYAKALNDTAFYARGAMQKDFQARFDRVTPFIERAPKVVKATPDNLAVRIIPTLDTRNLPSKGGKVGVDPQDVLQAQEFGGKRRDKRSEVALRRAGILPNGYQTAIPSDRYGGPYPGSDDGRGNLRGPFLAQLISYFQAFGEQGYRANMTAARKRRLRNQQGIGDIQTRKVNKTTLGVRYFVNKDALRDRRGGAKNPGIYAVKGLHDSDMRAVLMFIRIKRYIPRISMDRIAAEAGLQDYLDRRVRFRIREAAGV